MPNYPCKECCKNVRSNQAALLCAVCTTWTHAKCVGLTKETFEHCLAFVDIDWTCSWCNLPFANVYLSFEELNMQIMNSLSVSSSMEGNDIENEFDCGRT